MTSGPSQESRHTTHAGGDWKLAERAGSGEPENTISTTRFTVHLERERRQGQVCHKNDVGVTVVMSESKLKPAAGSEWVVDSGATSHICTDGDLFVMLSPYAGRVASVGSHHRIDGKGTIRLHVKDVHNHERILYLTDALVVLEYNFNLLPLHKATKTTE